MSRPTLVMALLLATLVVVEWLWTPHHLPVFAYHHWVGLQALIGLGSCLLVVKLSKLLGKWFLQRAEEHDV